jgi:hypothetical protein
MALVDTADIAARLGRDLTADETTQAESLIVFASALIADAVGEEDPWEPDPVPAIVTHVAVEIISRAMLNPQGLKSSSETLGAHSFAATYADAGLAMTKAEELLLRRAVIGSVSGSTRVRSVADDVLDSLIGS